jgi:hypothetical protein
MDNHHLKNSEILVNNCGFEVSLVGFMVVRLGLMLKANCSSKWPTDACETNLLDASSHES